jgi:hypothetical protein
MDRTDALGSPRTEKNSILPKSAMAGSSENTPAQDLHFVGRQGEREMTQRLFPMRPHSKMLAWHQHEASDATQ